VSGLSRLHTLTPEWTSALVLARPAPIVPRRLPSLPDPWWLQLPWSHTFLSKTPRTTQQLRERFQPMLRLALRFPSPPAGVVLAMGEVPIDVPLPRPPFLPLFDLPLVLTLPPSIVLTRPALLPRLLAQGVLLAPQTAPLTAREQVAYLLALQALPRHQVAYLGLDQWTSDPWASRTGFCSAGAHLHPGFFVELLGLFPETPVILTRPNVVQAQTDRALIQGWDKGFQETAT
jgi:hypothetical protein